MRTWYIMVKNNKKLASVESMRRIVVFRTSVDSTYLPIMWLYMT